MTNPNDNLLKEAEKEAEFFNKYYSEADKRHKLQNYLVPSELVQQVTRPNPRPLIDREYACSLLGKLENKKLLDYGAGDGWNAICFAKAKAKVWAIDISEVGINLTRKKAEANGVDEFIIADVRDCYQTGYPDDMFDIVYGGGVLHHLNLMAAGQELSRILRHDGVAVFYEPIRENQIMDFIKAKILRLMKRKPSEETDNEGSVRYFL